jgi:hypothetical protein
MEPEADKKLEYEAPVLKLIELRAVEVLGTACKTAPGAGGPGGECQLAPCLVEIGAS